MAKNNNAIFAKQRDRQIQKASEGRKSKKRKFEIFDTTWFSFTNDSEEIKKEFDKLQFERYYDEVA